MSDSPKDSTGTSPASAGPSDSGVGTDFIRSIINEDIRTESLQGAVHTRFPPEPNGYLHIGHAKSIILNFGIAQEYRGLCNLRFDDTNPVKEDTEFVESIMEDIRWLGFDWEDRLYFASDYFEQLYQWAEWLISHDKAYVDELSAEEIRLYRGTPTEPGRNSPWRDRPRDESLDMFRRMRKGEFPDGHCIVRARIDMAHPNINMRDPALYRIRHVHHHRTGDAWCIYPTYDFAHGQSDALEGITHSICTLEFENHRPLYDWLLENLPVPHRPRQIEFARLNLTWTVMSKRKLLRLVQEGFVDGWDDPRMPTICGLRRRGYTPRAIKDFCARIGVSKTNSTVDLALLEFSLREDLNARAPRYMGVVDPVKLVITNWPQGKIDSFDAPTSPDDPQGGTRQIPFSGELYVEREDYMDDPPRKWFRLGPGREVRLKFAYYVTCQEVLYDETGSLVEIRCTYDPESRGGDTPDGRKVKGTIHWVSAAQAVPAEIRLYETLFDRENPEEEEDFTQALNPRSLQVRQGFVEPALASLAPGESVQFLRMGYFCRDIRDGQGERPVFNRSVTLKDAWARIIRNQRENE
ncbi:glutamine--tRNA ligase [Alkalispirochaeta sphaeroplastigenens]|uniref:Glutamine--tRNA ligase n=1 Tax=Alkalispirochaeta sphaeroplastigenens TaxID=1187066 RepID=A0A2S4K0L8_9SPIO|nr:glutamine--tRNA ligase/YqeY domain fusion protein [Alkalispirochaeta sphaeroplastigenens]POR05298.1 glutamine--tRNA ligase [Alkalispirochaeta sphaeroplastigenens]